MICTCDQSTLFPRCNKNPEYCPKVAENRSNIGYSTGMWSDEDDRNPRMTPVFGPNR